MNDLERNAIERQITRSIEEQCLLIDEYAKIKFAKGTPEYELQQGLIDNVKRYREGWKK